MGRMKDASPCQPRWHRRTIHVPPARYHPPVPPTCTYQGDGSERLDLVLAKRIDNDEAARGREREREIERERERERDEREQRRRENR